MPDKPHHVVMVLSENMPIFEAAVPCEIFGIDRPDLGSPWYRFSVVGLGGGPVRMSSGFVLATSDPEHHLISADTLVVPACENVHVKPPEALVDIVRAAHERGARILSICSGAFVLAAAGVLDGRRATTHWMHAAELAQRYPAAQVDSSVLYVEDGNVITSAGTVAGIDACLHVVRVDYGAAVAAAVARRIVTPPHRDGGQAQYYRPPGSNPAGDDWLASLVNWSRENLHLPLTTAELAKHAKVSTRTVERRFAAGLRMSPIQWLLQQRVRCAQELLESTDRPIDWIASACGFGTAASLRAHFARIVGASPTSYRSTFRHRPEGRRMSVTQHR